MLPFEPPDKTQTIGELIGEYLASPAYGGLAPSTRDSYGRALRRMSAVFGHVRTADVEPAWLQHWLLQRSDAPYAANYELAALSVVMSRAVRAGVIERNPCREVQRHPAPPRSRYVTDAEVSALRRHCSERANAYIDLKLSTGARQGQLVRVRWADWDGDELYVRAAKGGKDTWYGGPGVRAALTACAQAFHGAALEEAARLSSTVIVTRSGAPYRHAKSMIANVWRPAIRRYLDSDPSAVDFREHDLRAKVASDSDSVHQAQERLGHRTTEITERVYMRKPRRVKSADPRLLQPDLFDALGGSAASSKDAKPSSAASLAGRGSKAASAAHSPRRSEPAAGTSAGSPAKRPSPPARADRKDARREAASTAKDGRARVAAGGVGGQLGAGVDGEANHSPSADTPAPASRRRA